MINPGGGPAAPLLGPIFARGPDAAQTSEGALLQAMLDAKAALARACVSTPAHRSSPAR